MLFIDKQKQLSADDMCVVLMIWYLFIVLSRVITWIYIYYLPTLFNCFEDILGKCFPVEIHL